MLKVKKNYLKRQEASKPDSYMAEILELSDQEFKVTMINMLWAVMEKVVNM